MEAKEAKDLLILVGQWMFIKSKTDTFKSMNQHFIIQMVGLNDLLFLKSYDPFRIFSY